MIWWVSYDMENETSIRVTERIHGPQDFSDKKKILKRIIDQIYDLDGEFMNMFLDIITSEKQKGEIIKAIGNANTQFKEENYLMLENLEKRADDLVYELQYQVNNMNLQSMTVTYIESVSQP